MHKNLIMLLHVVTFCFNIVAQNSGSDIEKQIELAKAKSQLNRINICAKFNTTFKNEIEQYNYIGGNYVAVKLNPYVNFMKVCEDYREIIEFDKLNFDKNPDTPNRHIVYSVEQKKNETKINAFVAEVSVRTKVSARPQVPSVRPQVDKTKNAELKSKLEAEIKSLEAEVIKITNTQKYYQDLSDAQKYQLKSNAVEIAGLSGDLLLKHVSIPMGDVMKEQAMKELRKLTDSQEEPNPSELANVMNKLFGVTDEILGMTPGGDIIANHWGYKVYQSLPEAGSILGKGLAELNIYFRQQEFDDKIQEKALEKQQKINLMEQLKYQRSQL